MDPRPSLFEIEAAIIDLIKEKVGEDVVVRDAEFNTTEKGWEAALISESDTAPDEVHAVIVSVVEYSQRRSGTDKEISPIFGIDFIRQYTLGSPARQLFYDEFELVSDYISQHPDLGLEKRIAGHDELIGSRIGTRTIVGVKLRVLPTTLKVRLHPVDVVYP